MKFKSVGAVSRVVCLMMAFLIPLKLHAAEDFVVGVLIPLTGAHILEGQTQSKALDLAVEQINGQGGIKGRSLKLILHDNESSESGSLKALNDLTSKNKLDAIIVGNKTNLVASLYEKIQTLQIPAFTGATAASLTEKQSNGWLFRIRANDKVTSKAMLSFVKDELKLSKIGILHSSDSFGNGGADLISLNAKDFKINVAKQIAYAPGERDFRPMIRRFEAEKIEILCVYGTGTSDIGILQRQIAELKPNFKYIGSPSSQYKGTLKVSLELADGFYAMSDLGFDKSAEATKYADDYQKKFATPFDPGSVWIFDSLSMLAYAARSTDQSPQAIRKALSRIDAFKGVSGTYDVTENGDALHEVSVVRLEKGEGKPVKSIRIRK